MDLSTEQRLQRCDLAVRTHRYGLLRRGERWKLVAFEHAYSRSPDKPETWSGYPEWMTLDELEACLGIGED